MIQINFFTYLVIFFLSGVTDTYLWASFKTYSCLSAVQKDMLARNLSIEQFAKELDYKIEYEPGEDMLRLVNKQGEEMAYIELRLESKRHAKAPNFIFIKFLRVDPKIKENRVGLALLKYAIDKYPHAEGVYGVMAADNKAAIEAGLASGKNLHQSIQETHFYKGLSKLGFGEISEDSTESTVLLRHEVKTTKNERPSLSE